MDDSSAGDENEKVEMKKEKLEVRKLTWGTAARAKGEESYDGEDEGDEVSDATECEDELDELGDDEDEDGVEEVEEKPVAVALKAKSLKGKTGDGKKKVATRK